MKSATIKIIAFMSALTGGSVEAQNVHPVASVKLRVVDEEGRPVSGASAGVGFEVARKDLTGTDTVGERRLTNDAGEASFSGQTPTGYLSYGARAEGYYRTTNLKHEFQRQQGGHWIPKDTVLEVVLKKIGKPVPMYVRKVAVEIPVIDQVVGLDLMAGDWVAPHGEGVHGDLLCKVSRRFAGRRDYDVVLEVTFPNPQDGIAPFIEKMPPTQGSELRLPRAAPEEGYQNRLATAVRRQPDGPTVLDARPDMNYFLRVRTVLDENGRIKSAMYGKIHGDIRLGAISSKTCHITFSSYLNPTPNDRNVEWDTTRNLAKGPTADEALIAP